ncbi:MAG: enoyl-CoA hydratase/isomerase family protein [Chloroflexota bacterium]|nr:enoyl-CoA hydratase/isomerase family protein [Chloroflexota bacterium]
MTDYQALRLERREGVALLTLNRPERRNAMTPELTQELPRALDEIRRDGEARALVITGTGSVFCAGGDLAMLGRMLEQPPEQNRREMGAFYRTYLDVLNLDVPAIAALNGHAVGAGAAFTLGCDIRLIAAGATIGFTFLNLGLHPGMGTTHLLPQVVGSAHAAELIFTGRMVGAEEALAMGLVSRIVPPDRLLDEALALAAEMAAKPPSGVRMAKRALARPKIEGLEAALDYEAAAQMTSYASPEMREAFAALARKQ